MTRPFKLPALALGLLLSIAPSVALAFPATIELISTVQQGQRPKIIVHIEEAAKDAKIVLKRDDGQVVTFQLGEIVLGQSREFSLDGATGRHNYTGEMAALVEGEWQSSPLAFETIVKAPMTLEVDRSLLDLANGTLTFRCNSKLASAQLTILDVDGSLLHRQNYPLDAAEREEESGWVKLSWPKLEVSEIFRIELRAYDADGFFKGIALTPWSVNIPHEEVLFSTNSASIDQAEEAKLERSLETITAMLQRFRQLEGVQLFIAGHTDTSGAAAHNAELSRKRAHAIAQWFAQHHVPTPVYFRGFGESLPRVKTGDGVAEAANRRVDYILSVEAPTLQSSTRAWQRLK